MSSFLLTFQFVEGEELDTKLSVNQKETQKPNRVTESELNNFLKNPFKKKEVEDLESINDDEEYKMILEGCEIGTVATRAGIIKNAQKYEYIKESKGHLECENKGIKLIEVLEKLNINLDKGKTVEFGKQLKKIYRNEIEINNVIDKVKDELNNIVECGNKIQIDKIESKGHRTLAICPVCGQGKVIVGKTGYGCSRWKEGCKFFIGKQIAGKSISESIAKKLIEDKKTGIIKGFKSKSGKNFDAALKIEDSKITFDFSIQYEGLGICPVCGKGKVKANKSGYGCSAWKEGCKFFISNKIAGKTISESIAKKLISDKKTGIIKGFKSKSGKNFDVALKVENGKITFDFT